jgi:RNA recognition motif-containing protein
MSSEGEARAALAANGTQLHEQTLRVDLAADPRLANDRSVFVGNLPFVVEEEELRAFFQVRSVTCVHALFIDTVFSHAATLRMFALCVIRKSISARALRSSRFAIAHRSRSRWRKRLTHSMDVNCESIEFEQVGEFHRSSPLSAQQAERKRGGTRTPPAHLHNKKRSRFTEARQQSQPTAKRARSTQSSGRSGDRAGTSAATTPSGTQQSTTTADAKRVDLKRSFKPKGQRKMF